jgi:Xaa-Pro aminopeptidase
MMFEHRTRALKDRMREQGIDIAIITDDDAVYYFTGYYDYLHMEFGRPTILLVHGDGETLLITPAIDYNTALDNARVDRIEPWNDGMGNEWREHLPAAFKGQPRVAIEPYHMPAVLREYLSALVAESSLDDITPLIAAMRMIKSSEELQLARHAGEVATAMMQAGREAIAHGVPVRSCACDLDGGHQEIGGTATPALHRHQHVTQYPLPADHGIGRGDHPYPPSGK